MVKSKDPLTTSYTGEIISASTEVKYKGILEPSISKQIRRDLILLEAYFDDVLSQLNSLVSFTTIVRILQVYLPATFASMFDVFTKGDLVGITMNVLSILCHVIPSYNRSECYNIFLFIYFAIMWVYFITFLFSAIYFRKKAKLNIVASYYIRVMTISIAILIQPIAAQFIGEMIGLSIRHKTGMLEAFIILIFVLLTFCIYTWIIINVTTVSLIFRKESLMTVQSKPQLDILLGTVLPTFLMGIACKTAKYARDALLFATAIILISNVRLLVKNATFIIPSHAVMFGTASIAAALNCVYTAVIDLIGHTATLFAFYTFVCVLVVSYGIVFFILYRGKIKNLILLDDIFYENKQIADISSLDRFLSIIVTGFLNCHPICLTWKIFQMGLNQWPNNTSLLFVFAKFVAIYPEQSKTLDWIQTTIVRNGLKGSVPKNLIIQINTILRQRQMNLSVELKREINLMTKAINSTKHRLCSVWDLIIQGNTKDMEAAIDRAYTAVQKNDMELLHLIGKYPNNRYVTKLYSQYHMDISGNMELYKEWQEKSHRLQRGQMVSPDRTHSFGMAAFPNLPVSVTPHENSRSGEISSMPVSAAGDYAGDEDAFGTTDDESQGTVKQYIDAVKIPAITRSKWQSFILMFISVFLPPIVLLICLAPFVNFISTPLPIMKALGDMRLLSFQTSAFTVRYLMENIDNPNDPSHKLAQFTNLSSGVKSFGGQTTTLGMLEYVINKVPPTLEAVAGLRDYRTASPRMLKARQIIFSNSINYTVRTSPTKSSIVISSADTILQDNTNYLRRVLEKGPSSDRFSEIELLTAFSNMRNCADAATEVINLIIESIAELATQYKSLMYIIDVVYGVLILITYVASSIWIIRATRKMKDEVYKALISLPKSAVSLIAEGLRSIKKKTGETNSSSSSQSNSGDVGLSRQEETMMKTFASAGDGSGSTGMMHYLQIFAIIISCVCGLVILVICTNMYVSTGTQLFAVAPHITFMMGTTGYTYSMLFTMMYAGCGMARVPGFTDDYHLIMEEYSPSKTLATQFYSYLRLGTPEKSIRPYSGLDEMANKLSFTCNEESELPLNAGMMAHCYLPPLQISLFQGLSDRIVNPYNLDKENGKFDPYTSGLDIAWTTGAIDIYSNYMQPMADDILETIQSDLFSVVYIPIGISVAFIIVAVIAQVLFSWSMGEDGKRLKFALSLLLQCPSSTVTKNAKIMAVLSGNYGDGFQDTTTRNSEFYNKVVHNMVDAIITANDSTILSCNVAGGKLFKKDSAEIVGIPVTNFFTKERFGTKIAKLFVDNNSKLFEKENNAANMEYHIELEEICLDVTISKVQGIIILSLRDETQMVYHSKLIDEERSKSDKLLSAILPTSLVPRVQAGESNISFSVQSATVCFIDIVSFTPWCSSNTAQHVMMVLNTIFKDFDRLVAESSTITKIKCIGDCYMAAGGIFAEINQPAEHAREMVQFGINAIHVINDINKKLNQSLQIRVGINSGGPLIAGVIGTEKPTFEIIGPCINMAQQMEHNGLPMVVHISRSTYELIYGASFNVKERGQIDIKGGKVTTYLVNP